MGEWRRARVLDEDCPLARRVEVAVRVRRAACAARSHPVPERPQRVALIAADVDVAEDGVLFICMLQVARQWNSTMCCSPPAQSMHGYWC